MKYKNTLYHHGAMKCDIFQHCGDTGLLTFKNVTTGCDT